MHTGELLDGINGTLVCLVPKVKNPEVMTDLRPISLCNIVVRILSKVLSYRLKQFLGALYRTSKMHIEGRLLTDNSLIAFEMNHYIK